MTAFCVIGDVEALTQVTYSTLTNPTAAQVTAWIVDISAWIEEYTGMKYSEQTETNEKHDGDGTPYIKTDKYPITSVSSLVVDGATLTENTHFWIESKAGGLIECLTAPIEAVEGYAEGHKNITITYKWGKTAVPQAIEEFCAVIVALKALNAAFLKSNVSGVIKAYNDGDVAITYSETETNTTDLLKRYAELKATVPKKIGMEVT